ncbi:MAG TPA: efflux RND transporter periplasmic adaptor subunit [Bryobacteraceae bacterium]|nr:efflux RND transporter periplasmic adaptor subunit [Bryobacteraceae bacterium]
MRGQTVLALLLALGVLLFGGCQASRTQAKTRDGAAVSNERDLLLASPGRVETREDPLDIGVAANGVLVSLPVRQNDRVHAGQVLARLDCRELAAEMSQYESELEVAVRTRARLVAGGRPEDRAAAAARVVAAEATLRERRAWFERIQGLAAKDDISKSDFDRAEREWRVAEADYQTAVEQRRAAAAEPLPEDLAKSDAEIQAAEARIGAAKARLAKCTVESPIDATVLRTYATEGEFLSAANPKSILTLANLTRLRVRAEVDEQDVGKVKGASRATVISDGWPGKTFAARISYQAPIMGRRHTRTGDPAERSDRDILEVLVDLDPAAKSLPLGLRVTVQFWR